MIECGTGVFVACLPTLRPLLGRLSIGSVLGSLRNMFSFRPLLSPTSSIRTGTSVQLNSIQRSESSQAAWSHDDSQKFTWNIESESLAEDENHLGRGDGDIAVESEISQLAKAHDRRPWVICQTQPKGLKIRMCRRSHGYLGMCTGRFNQSPSDIFLGALEEKAFNSLILYVILLTHPLFSCGIAISEFSNMSCGNSYHAIGHDQSTWYNHVEKTSESLNYYHLHEAHKYLALNHDIVLLEGDGTGWESRANDLTQLRTKTMAMVGEG